jgi:ribosomal-protein-alanine N-acetyltransferase
MEFTLRPFTLNDLDSLVENANDIEIAKFMTDAFPHPYTKEKGISFIEFANKNSPPSILAIDVNGKAIGGVGIHLQSDVLRKNAELGYWVGQKYWGHKIATRVVISVTDDAFHKYDLNRIYAKAFGKNLASQRVLEKTGFTLEAKIRDGIFKNGEYQDELIYAIRKDEAGENRKQG